MSPNVHPKPARYLGIADLPFMLNERHCLLNSFGCQSFIAPDTNEIETRKAVATVADTKALGYGLHVCIDGDQDGVICKRGRRDNIVCGAGMQYVTMQNGDVTARLENFAYRIWNAFIQKNSQNRSRVAQAASLWLIAADTSSAVSVGYSFSIC